MPGQSPFVRYPLCSPCFIPDDVILTSVVCLHSASCSIRRYNGGVILVGALVWYTLGGAVQASVSSGS